MFENDWSNQFKPTFPLKVSNILVTDYGTRSVMETLSTDKVTSKQPDFNR